VDITSDIQILALIACVIASASTGPNVKSVKRSEATLVLAPSASVSSYTEVANRKN